MFPATVERVEVNTSDEVNRSIRRRTKASVEAAATAGPMAISNVD